MAAVIFDLDGLLIDSEPLWKEEEIEIFNALGVPLSWEMTHETMGMRMIEVVAHWRARFPFDGPGDAEVERATVERVIRRIEAEPREMPGAKDAVARCRRLGYPLALATSSPLRLAQAALEALGLSAQFDAVCSAEYEPHGKPHPAVFLAAAQRLKVDATSCLVLEDSVNGVIAARSARMKCIAVPIPELRADPRYVLADRVLSSLAELDGELIAAL